MAKRADNSVNGLAKASGQNEEHARGSGKTKDVMLAVRQFASQVALRFEPERIILFGSYAYGTPHPDSDVDILVVMPARNQHDQAVKIRRAVPRAFPMDLIVRTAQNLERRLATGDLFHTEIVAKGKVLYEAGDAGVGEQGGRRSTCRVGIAHKQKPTS